jgi:hypothetical protein
MTKSQIPNLKSQFAHWSLGFSHFRASSVVFKSNDGHFLDPAKYDIESKGLNELAFSPYNCVMKNSVNPPNSLSYYSIPFYRLLVKFSVIAQTLQRSSETCFAPGWRRTSSATPERRLLYGVPNLFGFVAPHPQQVGDSRALTTEIPKEPSK